MTYSRRQFGKLAITGLPLAATALASPLRLIAEGKPDSKINGVQIGVITPYSYHNMPNDAESLLRLIVEDGIDATEIQCPPVEEWAGAPADPPAPQRPAAGQPRPKLTMAEIAARKGYANALSQWRLAAPMEKFAALRKMYNDAGVSIYGFKLQLEAEMQDAEFDYAFRTAKALGANQLTMEMPDDGRLTARIGTFASRHELMVGFHAHTQARPTTWDEAMAQSAYNGINLDIGHYVAAGNHDALEFIRKHHERITSMHLKDRRFPENGGANMPWGQGDTPIKEALQLMKREGYKFPATIELEYAPPPGSDSEKEVLRCLAYARAALA